jgi:insulysin
MVWSAAARIIRPPTSSPVSTRRHEEPTLRHPHFIPAFFIALLLGGCAAVTSDRAAVRGPTAGAAVADSGGSQAVVAPPVTVVQSPNDDRDYRFLTLDNGLQVLLVSDPATDKAAASLVVFRGSYHDPDEYPGLAHFLEHMLFIGTEKYPEVDGYQTFISQHGGSSNAYTAGDHTNYFFDIHPGQFRAAMDRFAQFFISPLFAEEYVEREKNAVHSEYQMQLKADNWRAAAVIRAIANPEHPHSRFNIGALETLGDGVQGGPGRVLRGPLLRRPDGAGGAVERARRRHGGLGGSHVRPDREPRGGPGAGGGRCSGPSSCPPWSATRPSNAATG